MSRVLVSNSSLQDIASAIREKNGTQETYKPSEMGDAIRAIPTGEKEETITLATSFINLAEACELFSSLVSENDVCNAFILKKYIDAGISGTGEHDLVAIIIGHTATSLGWWRDNGGTLYSGTGAFSGYATKANIGDVFIKKVIL